MSLKKNNFYIHVYNEVLYIVILSYDYAFQNYLIFIAIFKIGITLCYNLTTSPCSLHDITVSYRDVFGRKR